MREGRVGARGILLAGAVALAAPALGQTNPETSCAQKLDAQLRRFNEQCIADLVTYTATLPKGAARIASEKDKYYVRLTRTEAGLQGESVSKQNFPFMKPDTESALKALGWTPPDVEFGGFKRSFSEAEVKSGSAAREVSKALEAYGMSSGEAIAVTVAETER